MTRKEFIIEQSWRIEEEIYVGNPPQRFKFRRQYSVQGYVVDFFCSEKRLAIELLGGIHKKTKRYDKYRKEYIEAFWIKILEFKNEEVEENMEKVLAKIKFNLTSNPSP